jgi:hypothetical protein
MLKYLPITVTTAIVNLVLVSTTTVQIANAALAPVTSTPSIDRGQLIAKGEKSAHISAQQQSDVQSIHQTLTQFYRGLNEYSVDRMARAAVPASAHEKEYLQRLFNRLRSARVDVSVEIKNIELVSLSAHNALVKIDQIVTAKGPERSGIVQQSSSIALVKYRGQWKVADGDTVTKSLNRN